jgi:hypothetical protein
MDDGGGAAEDGDRVSTIAFYFNLWCVLLCTDMDGGCPENFGRRTSESRNVFETLITSERPGPGLGVQDGGQRAFVCGVVFLSQDTLHTMAFSGVDMTIWYWMCPYVRRSSVVMTSDTKMEDADIFSLQRSVKCWF